MMHALDVQARIRFCPESQSMSIRFSGSRDGDMPYFSNELLDLASGARRVTIDLRDLRLTDPESTVESILSALGQHVSEIEILVVGHASEIEMLVAEAKADPALRGSYHAG